MRNHSRHAGRAILVLAVSAALGGCKTIDAPAAQVIPQAKAEGAWLQNATVHYQAPLKPSSAELGAALASRVPVSEPVLTLAVQYPHPNGDRDLALAEAVIAEDSPDAAANRGAGAKIVGILRDALPGVALDEGVVQAKALDIPVAELTGMLTLPGTAARAEAPATENDAAARLSASVNGQPHAIRPSAARELDQLAKKVCREGRLISYRRQ